MLIFLISAVTASNRPSTLKVEELNDLENIMSEIERLKQLVTTTDGLLQNARINNPLFSQLDDFKMQSSSLVYIHWLVNGCGSISIHFKGSQYIDRNASSTFLDTERKTDNLLRFGKYIEMPFQDFNSEMIANAKWIEKCDFDFAAHLRVKMCASASKTKRFTVHRKNNKKKHKFDFLILDEGVKLGKNFQWDDDVFFGANCIVGDNVTAGKGVIVGNDTHIGHNVAVGKFTLVGSNCYIGDSEKISAYSFLDNYQRVGTFG